MYSSSRSISVSSAAEMTGGELLAHVGFQKALGGDEKYWSESAKRFWLKTEKRELAMSGKLERQEPPEVVDTDELVTRAVKMLAALAEPVDDPESSRR